MKSVYDTNHELAHAWAHQLSPKGRTPNSNFYFEGKTIYSYGKHFPIATLLDDGTVQFTSRGYSITTNGKHLPAAHSAVSHLTYAPSCHTPFIDSWKSHILTNADDFRVAIQLAVHKVQRSTTAKQLVRNQETLQNAVNAAQAWANWVEEKNGIDALEWKISRDDRHTWLTVFENLASQIAAADSWLGNTEDETFKQMLANNRQVRTAHLAREKEAKRKQEEERIAVYQQRLQEWRLGGPNNIPHVWGDSTAHLRWNCMSTGWFLQTSKGINIPKQEAILAFTLWKKDKIVGHKVDGYLVTHNADGYLQAGCHRISWEEIEAAIAATPKSEEVAA